MITVVWSTLLRLLLAALGVVMLAVGTVSIVSLILGRLRVSGAATVVGVGLILAGYGIGIGCFQ
jgi:hypothetical protein